MARDPVVHARMKLARASRYGSNEDVADARREFTLAKLYRAIDVALAADPPLTREQLHRAALHLRGGGR